MNGDPKEARLNCARFQLPTSFVRQPGMGKRDGQRGPKDEERVEETVQVVHQSRDLFDAVLNGRLEIKKLRINASWDWLASPFFSFCFLSFVPPTFSSIFFFSSYLPSLLELSSRRARLIPGRKANFASERSLIDEGLCQVLQAFEKFTLRFPKLAEKTITSSRLVDWKHEDYFVLSVHRLRSRET